MGDHRLLVGDPEPLIVVIGEEEAGGSCAHRPAVARARRRLAGAVPRHTLEQPRRGRRGRMATAHDRLGFEDGRDAAGEACGIPSTRLDEAERELARELRVVGVLSEAEGTAGLRRRIRTGERPRHELRAARRAIPFDVFTFQHVGSSVVGAGPPLDAGSASTSGLTASRVRVPRASCTVMDV
jgi:hypothetical protein